MQVGMKAHARFAEYIQSFFRAAFGTAMLSELQMFRVVALLRLLTIMFPYVLFYCSTM